MYEVNTIRLLTRVYGIASGQIYRPYRNVPERKGDKADSEPYSVDMPEQFESDVVSTLGVPVMMPVRFLAGRYQERLTDGTLNVVEYDEYLLPFASLFTVEKPKHIKTTAVVGGTEQIEYIANRLPRVNFRGLIINTENDLPPEDGIRAFDRITGVPAAIDVECEYLQWHGINSLVVERPRTFQIEGYSHVVGFSMSCYADSPTEVRLRNDL